MMEKLNRYEKLENEGAYLTIDTGIISDNDALRQIAFSAFSSKKNLNAYTEVQFINEIDENLKERINKSFGDIYRDNDDDYVIDTNEVVRIYSESLRGLVYGAYTLQQIAKEGFLYKGIIYNTPLCPFRGLKVYLPAADEIEYFKTFIDMACYYRYNTIVLEVGGAMEYRKHPEINEGWVEYCSDMCEHSGKASKIQAGYKWEKNSIHCENGGGRWLSQEIVRGLVAYCKERGLDVIPEMPTLSHCDYLLTKHPELAERIEDPYPDTYCPSNPSSYELLFDVLEEVIEVFKPDTMHVGHDEFYSFGLCDKCKNKDGAEIYAEDLKKIYGFLTAKGIKTMIWGDKLLNCISKRGETYGGSARAICDDAGNFIQFIPPTYKAIDMIPKDVRIMNWYWSMGREYDLDYLKRDLYTVCGNLEGPAIPDWSNRLARGMMGAGISNWSALREDYLQRNGIFFNMAYCCRMFWIEGYDELSFASLAQEVFEDLFKYKNREILSGSYIEIIHSTDFKKDFQWFFDGKFIDANEDYLGEYEIRFDDDTSLKYPLTYGINISSMDRSWSIRLSDEFDMYDFDRSLIEVSCTALPVREGSKTYYKIVIGNPYHGRRIVSIEFKPKENSEALVTIQKVTVIHKGQ